MGREGLPRLSVLAPDHTGLTTQEQPSLYWYLSEPAPYPIDLTIIDDQTTLPLLRKTPWRLIQPGAMGAVS